jgi:hypothetical protein
MDSFTITHYTVQCISVMYMLQNNCVNNIRIIFNVIMLVVL